MLSIYESSKQNVQFNEGKMFYIQSSQRLLLHGFNNRPVNLHPTSHFQHITYNYTGSRTTGSHQGFSSPFQLYLYSNAYLMQVLITQKYPCRVYRSSFVFGMERYQACSQSERQIFLVKIEYSHSACEIQIKKEMSHLSDVLCEQCLE